MANTRRTGLTILITAILLILLLGGCAGLSDSGYPTPIPEEQIPTVIALTAAAANNHPTDAPVTAEPPEDAPQATPAPPQDPTQPTAEIEVVIVESQEVVVETPVTPEAVIGEQIEQMPVLVQGDIPDDDIKFYRPGPFSRVVSPFRVVVNLVPGFNNQLLLELFGEDGRILVRKVLEARPIPGYRDATLVTDLEFEISGIAEAARLTISVTDKFGRPRSINSVDLVLLQEGFTDLSPYGDLLEHLVIQQPAPNATVQGGVLLLSGLARTGSTTNLEIEIIDELGRILAYGTAAQIVAQNSDYNLFVAELNYTVSEPTRVRLLVRANGARIPGVAYLTSMEVLLVP